jgi:hypothetical protein
VGTADFDPGTGTTNLMSAGERDIFIQKLNANGNFIWAKQMGGIKYDEGQSITIDDFGNICTTGNFEDTADFDPGAGTTNLTSLGDRDIFTQKLDTDGNFLWAKQMGGIYTDRGQSITSDANGNVFTIGYFSDLVDFDPGVGTYNLTSKGWADIFIQKLDANGNFQWTIQMGGTGYDFGQSITTDGNGNIYSTGFFSDTVDFDPGAGTANLTSVHGYDVFIQKLNTATVGMIEKTFSEKIVVYPNPTNGKCSIEFDNHQELLTVSLRSLTGQEIMTRQFRNTNRIQLEINQPSGIYILEIVDGQGKMTALKIIKE